MDDIFTFLQKSEHHLDKQKALCSPIVKFIYYLPFDTTTINEAYSKYKTFSDSLAKHAVYAERNDEYYKGYNYVTLRKKKSVFVRNCDLRAASQPKREIKANNLFQTIEIIISISI